MNTVSFEGTIIELSSSAIGAIRELKAMNAKINIHVDDFLNLNRKVNRMINLYKINIEVEISKGIDLDTVYLWPDGTWAYESDYEDEVDKWKGFDFSIEKIPLYIDPDNHLEIVKYRRIVL